MTVSAQRFYRKNKCGRPFVIMVVCVFSLKCSGCNLLFKDSPGRVYWHLLYNLTEEYDISTGVAVFPAVVAQNLQTFFFISNAFVQIPFSPACFFPPHLRHQPAPVSIFYIRPDSYVGIAPLILRDETVKSVLVNNVCKQRGETVFVWF